MDSYAGNRVVSRRNTACLSVHLLHRPIRTAVPRPDHVDITFAGGIWADRITQAHGFLSRFAEPVTMSPSTSFAGQSTTKLWLQEWYSAETLGIEPISLQGRFLF